jgi:hypothetical protein
VDEDDEMAALAHQQELEARQWEEQEMERIRALQAQFRDECADFNRACEEYQDNFRRLTCR